MGIREQRQGRAAAVAAAEGMEVGIGRRGRNRGSSMGGKGSHARHSAGNNGRKGMQTCRTMSDRMSGPGGRPHQCVIAPIGSVQGQAAATLAALCVRARMSLQEAQLPAVPGMEMCQALPALPHTPSVGQRARSVPGQRVS